MGAPGQQCSSALGRTAVWRGWSWGLGNPGPLGQGSALSVSMYGVPGVSGGIWGLDAPTPSQLGWGFRGDLGIQGCASNTGVSESSHWKGQVPGQGSHQDGCGRLPVLLQEQIQPGLQIPPWIPSASSPWGSSTRASSRTTPVSTGMKLGGTLMELGGTERVLGSKRVTLRRTGSTAGHQDELDQTEGNWEAQGRQLGTPIAHTRLCQGHRVVTVPLPGPQVMGPYW